MTTNMTNPTTNMTKNTKKSPKITKITKNHQQHPPTNQHVPPIWFLVTICIKDTRSLLQSPLSKPKPSRIYETIVSYTAIFSDWAKPNMLSLWSFEKYVELWNTPILDHVGLLKVYSSQIQKWKKTAVLFEISSVNIFFLII